MSDDATLRATTPPDQIAPAVGGEADGMAPPSSAAHPVRAADHFAPFAWAALFLVLALLPLILGLETWLNFAGSAIDGPFQLYNALRRIQAGFRPGVGFQYFHGLGLPYLHYWLFRMTGGGLRGSEEVRELLSPIAFLAVLVIFFRAFTRRWAVTWCLATIALGLSIVLRLDPLMNAQNGMMGLRSMLPTLLAIPLALVHDRRWRTAIIGVGLGLSIFVSTEQGLAAFAAYLFVSAIIIASGSDKRAALGEAGATIALGVAVYLMALTAIGGISGMRGALRYNLRDVSMDQFWYFGTPPALFIPGWAAGLRLIRATPLICWALVFGIIAAVSTAWRLWRSPAEASSRRRAFAFMTAYAIISCASLLGIFVNAYVGTCWRVLILLSVLWMYEAASARTRTRGRQLTFGVPGAVAAVAVTCPVWMSILRPYARAVFLFLVPHVLHSHIIQRQAFTPGAIWPQTLSDGQRVIDAHRGPHGELPTLWSTYAGWIEARNGMFNPSFDYIIHALGPENRAAYLQAFEATKPTLVQTVSPTYSRFESWIEMTSWDFYADLLRNYAVVDSTPWSFYWARRATPLPAPTMSVSIAVPRGATGFAIPKVPADGALPYTLLQIEIAYDVHNPLHVIPLVGNSPRFLVVIRDAITVQTATLDPYVHVTRFPVLAAPGSGPTLTVQAFSLLPGASINVRSLRATVVPLDRSDAPWVAALMLEQSGRGHPRY